LKREREREKKRKKKKKLMRTRKIYIRELYDPNKVMEMQLKSMVLHLMILRKQTMITNKNI
jgi:hypothetical protein